ncbi:MAG: hypothetical protein U5L95_04070 [Candidatus Saccharibacteria bacterium]|nr:hypothetical protein [Candidatus Saccharibacteria bacterium]
MSDYDDLKQSGKIDEEYGSLKATLEMLDTPSSPSKEQYEKLAKRFEQAMKLIEAMKSKLAEIENKKIPTKDEVESMSAMLEMLNKLDIKTIDKLSMFENKDGK